MRQQLSQENLAPLLEAENLEELSFVQLANLFSREKGISNFIPDGTFQIDPRNHDRVVFNSSRARRPHDNRPDGIELDVLEKDRKCVICQGETTGVIDLADLSEGFTFINKNLYPVFYPLTTIDDYPADFGGGNLGSEGRVAHGFHFLQWTSSLHDRDWHNLPGEDRVVVMKRLAALEERLLYGFRALQSNSSPGGEEYDGYVSIIKNYGHLVGGSLVHGHQQIVFSNVMPKRTHDNWRFQQERGETFSAYMLRENPTELLIRNYGPAVMMVPFFMRRPFDMLLLVKDTSKRYLHELNRDEIRAVTDGWQDAIQVMLRVMPRIGREVAYNVTTNNGPGAGFYFEFLPYTQEIGGLEHLGLIICQGNPGDSAEQIRAILSELRVDLR